VLYLGQEWAMPSRSRKFQRGGRAKSSKNRRQEGEYVAGRNRNRRGINADVNRKGVAFSKQECGGGVSFGQRSVGASRRNGQVRCKPHGDASASYAAYEPNCLMR